MFVYRCGDVGLSERRPVRCVSVEVQRDWPMHTHVFFEILVVLRGRALQRTPGSEAELHPGSVVILAPGQAHAFERTAAFAIANIFYLAEALRARLGDLDEAWTLYPLVFDLAARAAGRSEPVVLHLHEPEYQRCVADLSAWLQDEREGRPSPAFQLGCFLKLMAQLDAACRARKLRFRADPPPGIRRSLTEIDRAVGASDAFRPREVATRAGMSYSRFSREFRRFTGESAMRYFQRHRIERAASLLATTGMSMTEIAHTLGFTDAAHFCRIFRRHYGQPPRSFRAQAARK